MKRRALVSQTRMPEIDRDRGSGRVDTLIRFLLDDGWSVTFLADEEQPDERHAHRLRQLGVATFAGYANAGDVIATGGFDLAVIAFWQQSARLIPLLRERSPSTKVIVDSIDVHFLRDARRRFGVDGRLDATFGAQVVDELNTYHAADGVLAVSEKEAALLGDFIGAGNTHALALGEDVAQSTIPFEERRGMLFVGNFRHLPNGEAIEFLCRDVLPRLDPALLAAHPLTVIGSWLGDAVRAHAVGLPEVEMVGWVPSVIPYLHRTRLSIVPLLHGAGVKGKVVQSMMAGTPVVTTPIGAEGIGLVDGEHAAVADDAASLAAAIARLLVDRAAWQGLADRGVDHARSSQDLEAVRARFKAIVDLVLATDHRSTVDGFRHARRRMDGYRTTVRSVGDVVRAATPPGAIVLVATKGDDDLLCFDGRTGWHFPQAADGGWAGYHPADGESAIRHLESLRDRGATHLVLPSSAFWWLHFYEDFAIHLETVHRRVHADEHAVLFDLRVDARRGQPVGDGARERVTVVGWYAAERGGPPPSLTAELDRSHRFVVSQHWTPAPVDPPPPDTFAEATEGWVVTVDDSAVLPSGFLDSFLTAAAAVDAVRAQPAHGGGLGAAAPATERLLGCVGREVSAWLPLPVRAVRAGAAAEGPVALIDEVPIGLTRMPVGCADARVTDVFVDGPAGVTRSVRRHGADGAPRISVVIATYDRADLLAGCLAGFAAQTLDPVAFEVVVVDDGSPGTATAQVDEQFGGRLPLVWARLDHAGRSAAKNLGVLLARGAIVLLFDDDDRPASDLLEEHLRVHDAYPDQGVAVLGFTDWAPELTVTPVMHYLTEVDKILFSYGNLTDGQQLDWRGFWEGRISCKRALLVEHGLHDQRLDYSIDIEMAWRLAPQGLKVVYHAAARSHMARPIDFDQFCIRIEAKGRAHGLIASLHDDPEIRAYAGVDVAADRWAEARGELDEMRSRVSALERSAPDLEGRAELHRLYRRVFAAYHAKGVSEVVTGATHAAPRVLAEPSRTTSPSVPERTGNLPVLIRTGADDGGGGVNESSLPELTVTIPVWSRTAELAEMAARTIERVWQVARLATEVVVVDNGSPHERRLRARTYRWETNRGVAPAWNAGIALARARVIAVLNSDCVVEPGWDEALYEAVTAGRRIAFPYTDHGDGLGFRRPDQAGTAGWCFMLTADVFAEVGPFDEQFSPAYCEDTDYWHRAWELDIELTPVPGAHVAHARRTTGRTDPHADWLLQAHRYKYGWKHGVDPLRAPPYYDRPIVEFVGRRDREAAP